MEEMINPDDLTPPEEEELDVYDENVASGNVTPDFDAEESAEEVQEDEEGENE